MIAAAPLLLAAGLLGQVPTSAPAARSDLHARTLVPLPDTDEIVYLATNLSLARGGLEVEGDFAILWIDRDAYARSFEEPRLRRDPEAPPPPERSEGIPERLAPQGVASRLLDVVKDVYVEGNVRFSDSKEADVRLDRLYLDVRTGRGVLVEPTLRTTVALSGGSSPLVVRAAFLRREANGVLVGERAALTTCPFAKPHYHVSADEIELREEAAGAFAVAARGTALKVGESAVLRVPVWSYSRGDRDWFPIREVRVGHSSRLGGFLHTEWGNDVEAPGNALNRILGVEERFRGRWTLDLDESLRRGPSGALEVDYGTPGVYRGELRTFLAQDRGDDRGPFSNVYERDDPTRGRVRWENRASLGAREILDTEIAYESDPLVLPEYFKREFREEKEPETAAYFRAVGDHLAFTALGVVRLNEFDPVPPEGFAPGGPPPAMTESLPRVGARAFVLPLPPLPLPGGFGAAADLPLVPYYTARIEAASLRRRFADADLLPGVPPFAAASDLRASRFDTVHRIDVPVRIPPVTVTPFGGVRYTAWSEWFGGDGGTGRFVGEAGARSSLHLERAFGALRHLVDPLVEYRNTFAATRDPASLIPFDETESAARGEVARVALRNRLASAGARTTYADLLLSLPCFPEADRDNAGRTIGDPGFDLTVAPWGSDPQAPRPVFRAVGEFDRGIDELGTLDTALRVPHLGPVDASVGYAEARDPLTGEPSYAAASVGAVLHAGEKWDFEGIAQYDLEQDRMLANRLVLRRIGHEWIFEIAAFSDAGSGDAGVSFRFHPAILFERNRPLDRRVTRTFFADEPPFGGAY